MRMRIVAGLLLGALAAACARGASNDAIELAIADRANAHVSLAADGRRVAAAWAATGDSGTDVYLAVSDDEGRTFKPPVRVNDIAGDASSNGEQPPRVAVSRETVSVIWVSKRGGATAIRSALSTDGGRTFAAPSTITPPGATGARGWESAAIAADGTLHAAWLDGRPPAPPPVAPRASATQTSTAHVETAQPKSGHHHAGAMKQNIYHAMWKPGEPPVEVAVAEDVCFCCKTALLTRGSDVYVAWRHLFPGGVRDIAIARSADGGRTFSAPARVSEDDWKIDACPDDGPAMAIDADGAIRVVWPTLVQDAAGARMGIFQAVSRDGGKTFAPRERMDAGDAAPAHPRVTDAAQGAAVVWDELAGSRRRVMLRVAGAAPIALSRGRAASYPAIAATPSGFVVAFTDQLEGRSVVQTLRVPAVRP
jgi:BNR repeat protein